ncbi:MAG: exodeoxyribonuclease V subunit beta [Nitriliruptoraceae bacterium]
MTAVPPFDIAGELPRSSLALEASAGTGKTWTLTSLTVRYVAEGRAELSQMLLVTFTRAATAELRDRVRRRLDEVLVATEAALAEPTTWRPTGDPALDRIVGDAAGRDDGGLELARRAARLRQATGQLDEATIATIHGFCQSMLQHAALEAGVDLDAVLLEDDLDLLAEIVDDHLARELRRADPEWIRYLQDAAGVGRASLTRLARAVASLPSLQVIPEPVDPEAGDLAPWQAALTRFRAVWAAGGRERAIAVMGELKDAGAFARSGQRTFTAKRAQTEAAAVDGWLAAEHPLPPGPLDPKKGLHIQPAHPFAYFTSRALAAQLADGTPAPAEPIIAAADALLAAVLAPATRFLHRAAQAFWHELDRRKRQRTVLTFDDLLRRLATALDDPDTGAQVRSSIRQRYDVALIDEFQDTDPVQWRIFRALFGEDEPFVLIGDPKQAIYGFRGADIHTYVRARDSRPHRATLATNHRSDRSLVVACNHLFGRDGAFATPDIPYHHISAHHDDRLVDPTPSAALQLRFIPREVGEVSKGTPATLTKGWADEALPRDVAAVVVELLTRGVTVPDDQGGRRPLVPRDVAVLVRTNRRALATQRGLRGAGVPAVIQRGGSVYDTEEAEALQRLLAALLRPSSQRAAVAVAAGPLFGRDAATLVAQLDALEEEVDGGRDAEGAWDAWIDALARWGERFQQQGVFAAVQAALDEDGVAMRLLAYEDGERRLTNIRHLLELLHREEAESGTRGHALLEWLQARRSEAADGQLATAETELRLEEDAQAVRVVTVHGSKGLQYPVVLCPDLWDGRQRVDARLTRFHDPAVEDPLEAITLDLDVERESPGKQRSLAHAEVEERTEALRLAYVALTRAEHRCIVWWGVFTDAATSPLATLLHAHGAASSTPGGLPDATDLFEAAEQHVATSDDQTLVTELEDLASAAEGTIGREVVERITDDARWRPPATPPPTLAAREATRTLDRSWRRTSFSALVRPASAHEPAVSPDGRDVDADVEDLDAVGSTGTPAPDEVEVPLSRFPRGPGPGTFLHDVLEQLDFTRPDQPEELDRILAGLEGTHGIDPRHRDAVRAGLQAALATPLGDQDAASRLADLAPGDRLDELRFELPLAGGHRPAGMAVTLAAVADLLAEGDDPLLVAYAAMLRDPALSLPVHGFLTGSIDLLARLPGNRFLVADYKSNWFGDRTTGRSVASDYRPERLREAMLGHHYVLQALLYLVAAHRYLRWRVPGYRYDDHMAGASYLFLRGMVGPQGADTGIVTIRPSGALIAALSDLMDGRRA